MTDFERDHNVPSQSEAIEDLTAAIQSGITHTSADGHSASQDLEHMERVRRELRLQDSSHIAAGLVRPTLVRIKLGNCW